MGLLDRAAVSSSAKSGLLNKIREQQHPAAVQKKNSRLKKQLIMKKNSLYLMQLF
jgi:hypothetical protein